MKTNKMIAALLALLGFSACEINIGGRVEYGTPHASFEIKGRVTDEKGEPVRDIKISVNDSRIEGSEFDYAVGITNSHGFYSVSGGWFGGSDLTVVAEDIDGDKNGGEFGVTVRELVIGKDDYVGGEGWNRGKVTKTADFTLELKPEDNETE